MKGLGYSDVYATLSDVSKFNNVIGNLLSVSPYKRAEVTQFTQELITIETTYNKSFKINALHMFASSTAPLNKQRKIVLLNDREKLANVPRAIPFWSIKNGSDVTTYCNITPYVKNKAVKNVSSVGKQKVVLSGNTTENIGISIPILYTMLEISYIQQNIDDGIKNQSKLIGLLSHAYAKLMVNLLEKNFGVGSSVLTSQELQAIFIIYFSNILMERGLESSVELMKSIIPSHKLEGFSITRVTEIFKKENLKLRDVVEYIASIYPRLNKLNYRALVSAWANDFGGTMLLGIDTPIYFIFNLLSVLHTANLNNEFRIVKLVDQKMLTAIYIELARSIK